MPDLEKIQVGSTTYDINGEKLEGKANVDGYYEALTAGNAEQLLSNVGIEDSVPYNFRTAGGSADIGDRETDKLVGGTIAWNQLMGISSAANATNLNGVDVTNNGDGSFTVNGTASSTTANYWFFGSYSASDNAVFVAHKDHVYLTNSVWFSYPTNSNQGALTSVGSSTSVGNTILTKVNTADYKARAMRIAGWVNGQTYNNLKIYPRIFDLTQMFGSTIADYIYSLEQSQAGAGVAWFKKLFPKPYYAYNAGGLIHVNASAHKMVGFNQFDKVGANLQQGNHAGTGTTTNVHTEGFTSVLPNTTYYYHADFTVTGLYFRGYAADGTSLGEFLQKYNTSSKDFTFTTPSECRFIKILWYNSNGITVANVSDGNVCINLHWDGERDGEYEPYEVHNYALDSDLVLRGIPKLDSANRLHYDGDTYESDGKVTRKYGIVDLGTLNWNYNSTDKFFYSADMTSILYPIAANTERARLICPLYETKALWSDGFINDGGRYIAQTSGNNNLRIFNSSYTTSADFKTAMSGVYLVYELATPTEEEADSYTNPQICSNWGTEEYVVTEQSGVVMPVGHDTFYQADLKAKLEMLPDSPDGDGDYIMRQTNGENTFIPYAQVKELPDFPTTDGTYVLKATVSGSSVTLAWVAE